MTDGGGIKKHTKQNIVTAALVFLFLLYLNLGVRYCTDDWHFQFVFQGFWPAEGDRRISSFGDLFRSAANYYRQSGGRVLAHAVTFLMAWGGQWIFDVVNSCLFVLLGCLVYLLVQDRRWRDHAFSLPLIYFCIMYFSFSFGDCALWLSGSVNYLWTAVLNLTAILCFEKYLGGKERTRRMLPLLCLLLFLAGQSNETTGGMLLIWIVLRGWKERSGKRPLFLASVFSVICGMAVVLLAPGNHNRAEIVHGDASFDLTGMLECSFTFLTQIWGRLWIFLLLGFLVFLLQICESGLWEAFCARRFFWMGIAGGIALGMSNTVILRGTFLPVVLLILDGCDCLEYLWQNRRTPEIFRRLLAALIILEGTYFLGTLFRGEIKWGTEDFVFLFRGAELALLTIVLYYLPDRKKRMEKIAPHAKKIAYVSAILFVGFFLLQNLPPFWSNCAQQREMEERAQKAASAREGEIVLIGSPIYQSSVFWPQESGVSGAYTQAWMKAYFYSEDQKSN